MSERSILLIDDEPLELEIFQHKARDIAPHDTSISLVADFSHAMRLALDKIDFIFLDYGCTEPQSLNQNLAELRNRGFAGSVVLMSNLPPEKAALEEITHGIDDNVDKRDIDQQYLSSQERKSGV